MFIIISPHVTTVNDAIWQTKTHHETTRCRLLSVEHSGVFNTNIHVIIADFLPEERKMWS